MILGMIPYVMTLHPSPLDTAGEMGYHGKPQSPCNDDPVSYVP